MEPISPIRLPTFSHFKNGNGWIGSAGILRYEIEAPVKAQEEGAPNTVTCVLWYGPFSRPYAQEFERRTFPVTDEGLASLTDYLTQEAQKAQEAPRYTPEDTMAFYLAKKAQEAQSEG